MLWAHTSNQCFYAMKVYESLLIFQPFEANFETVCSISNHMESPGKFRISGLVVACNFPRKGHRSPIFERKKANQDIDLFFKTNKRLSAKSRVFLCAATKWIACVFLSTSNLWSISVHQWNLGSAVEWESHNEISALRWWFERLTSDHHCQIDRGHTLSMTTAKREGSRGSLFATEASCYLNWTQWPNWEPNL